MPDPALATSWAAVGLLVWIAYVIAGSRALAWTAFIILLPVALLGFTMFARWLAGYRAGVPVAAMAGGPSPGCRTRGSRGLARA